MQPSEGSTLGNYRLVRVVGEGGMGVVWEAEQLNLGRRVALKMVKPSMAADPEFRARFKNEARVAASLDHPNILTVHDSDEIDGNLFLSMALVNGLSLRQLIDAEGFIGPEKAVELIGEVAAGLDAAHRARLVHRDVKPSNVLLDPELGRTLITDFGVAKALGSTRATSSGQMLGTLAYMSPEQIQGQDVDARADVYALGAMFHEMLTGSVAFPRESTAATMWAHINDAPPRPSVGTDVPTGFDEIIAKAMAKDPADRYSGVVELAAAAAAVADVNASDTTEYSRRISGRIDLSELADEVELPVNRPQPSPSGSSADSNPRVPSALEAPGALSGRNERPAQPGPASPSAAAGDFAQVVPRRATNLSHRVSTDAPLSNPPIRIEIPPPPPPSRAVRSAARPQSHPADAGRISSISRAPVAPPARTPSATGLGAWISRVNRKELAAVIAVLGAAVAIATLIVTGR